MRLRTMIRPILLILTILLTITPIALWAGDGKKKKQTGVEARRIGGFGEPGGDAGGGDAGGGDAGEETKNSKRTSKPGDELRFERKEPVASVLLPTIGTYRAPKILRLAGKLTGLEVRVARQPLNDIPIQIPRQLAKRHVGLDEVKVLLAANKLFLVEWQHPERGLLLVATDQPTWKPAPREFKHILDVHPRIFDQTWKIISAEIKSRNAHLPEAAARYAGMPVPRLGKIYVWAPTQKGLEEVVRTPKNLDVKREENRLQMATYRAKHMRVDELHEKLLKLMTPGEKKRIRVAAGTWANVILIRGTDGGIDAIKRRLEKLDKPKKKGSRT